VRTDGRGSIGGLIRFVSRLAEGERNSGLFWACCRAIEMGRADGLPLLVRAAVLTGLGQDEAERTARSAENGAG
jgi:hypothetical protein